MQSRGSSRWFLEIQKHKYLCISTSCICVFVYFGLDNAKQGSSRWFLEAATKSTLYHLWLIAVTTTWQSEVEIFNRKVVKNRRKMKILFLSGTTFDDEKYKKNIKIRYFLGFTTSGSLRLLHLAIRGRNIQQKSDEKYEKT